MEKGDQDLSGIKPIKMTDVPKIQADLRQRAAVEQMSKTDLIGRLIGQAGQKGQEAAMTQEPDKVKKAEAARIQVLNALNEADIQQILEACVEAVKRASASGDERLKQAAGYYGPPEQVETRLKGQVEDGNRRLKRFQEEHAAKPDEKSENRVIAAQLFLAENVIGMWHMAKNAGISIRLSS